MAETRGGDNRRGDDGVWRWVGWWLTAAVFYLLIYGELTRLQILMGLVVGAMAATLVIGAERLAGVYYTPGVAWAGRLLWRVPLEVLRDCALVLFATIGMLARKGVRGHFHTVPFAAIENTPQDAARRALAVLETSLAPNTFVINLDADKRRLLVHRFLSDAPGKHPPVQERAK